MCEHHYPFRVWTRDELQPEGSSVERICILRHWDCIFCGPYTQLVNLLRGSYPRTVLQPPSYNRATSCINRLKRHIEKG